jgi:hypothetical protein
MSGSDRDKLSKAGLVGTILVAVIGIGLYWSIFYSAGYGSGYNERKANIESEHYASDAAEQIERECSAVSGEAARKCITKIVQAERESQRGESDLAAQWKAADWVMWAGILAGAQLIATIAGLYYIKRTLDATHDAVGEARLATQAAQKAVNETSRIGEAQVRCYLSGTEATVFFHKNGTVTAKCRIKNSGQSPANRVRWMPELTVYIRGGVARTIPMLPQKLVKEHTLSANEREWFGPIQLNVNLSSEEIDACRPDVGLLVTLDIKLSADDVFGIPMNVTDRFTEMIYSNPYQLGTIKLPRTGEYRFPDGA